ncbi:MAG: hypothetical protein QG584_1176 [Pseudomonadota bacterium]|nr:hypothetical protein [Pseudomonadota bacterium]
MAMGFRYRKSIKIMPGVRMNVSKSGVGYSVGGKYGRVSHSATGRVTGSVSAPGTGMGYSKTLSSGSRSRSSSSARGSAGGGAADYSPAPPGPDRSATAGEQAFFAAMQNPDADLFASIAYHHTDTALAASFVEMTIRLPQPDQGKRARQLLGYLWDNRRYLASDHLFGKYLAGADLQFGIAEGVIVSLYPDSDTVGLIYAESLQERGNLLAAIDVVEQLEPTQVTALSLAELYSLAGRWADIVDLTNAIPNTDDATALINIYRGMAFRELGQPAVAREALKEALKSKSRTPAIRYRAHIERSSTYLTEGKTAMARKDLERILAEDASYPGLQEALAQLPPPR